MKNKDSKRSDPHFLNGACVRDVINVASRTATRRLTVQPLLQHLAQTQRQIDEVERQTVHLRDVVHGLDDRIVYG